MPENAAEARIAEYLDFARQRPDLFRTEPGGIRILLDPKDIARVETDIAAQLRRRGLPERGAEVGIVGHDPYVIFLRDAVEFPDGARRTHHRVINRIGNGAAVLPMLGDRVVLTRQFRHPLRRWVLEIPRGAIEPGETPEEAATAEVGEEIGGAIQQLIRLSFVCGSSNLYANGVHTFFARLSSVGAPQLSEAIASVEQFTVKEFERLISSGEIIDGATIGTFAHARLRGLI